MNDLSTRVLNVRRAEDIFFACFIKCEVLEKFLSMVRQLPIQLYTTF